MSRPRRRELASPWAPSALRRIAIGTVAAAVLACAGANKKDAAPPPSNEAETQMPTRSVQQQRGIDLATADLPTLETELDWAQAELTGLTEAQAGAVAEVEAGGEAADERPKHGSADAAGPRGLSANRCTRVCDLADHICTLRDRMCSLADEHEDDPRYADACERAEDSCTDAREACQTCTDAD